MEQIQIKDEQKKLYTDLVLTAQQIEQSIGSSDYRVYKLKKQREEIDVNLKTWWNGIAAEYKLDGGKDYYVDKDGAINQVDRPQQPGQPAAPAAPKVKVPVDLDAIPTQPEAPTDDKAGENVNTLV